MSTDAPHLWAAMVDARRNPQAVALAGLLEDRDLQLLQMAVTMHRARVADGAYTTVPRPGDLARLDALADLLTQATLARTRDGDR